MKDKCKLIENQISRKRTTEFALVAKAAEVKRKKYS